MKSLAVVFGSCVLLAALTATAMADTPSEKPWERNVSAQVRDEALRLFKSGNKLFMHSEYAAAAKKYRAALRIWNHPRIHGNLATALINLDEPLEAHRHLRESLRYGKLPFVPHVYQQLLTNRRLLLAQLARVEVRCAAATATVTMNGRNMYRCPGSDSHLVKKGKHQLVARKKGFLTFAHAFTALGGTTTVINVKLKPLAAAARYEQRWLRWKPWAVLASGIAVAGLAGLSQRASLNARDEYEAEIARTCAGGCDPATLPPAVTDLKSQARTWNRLAIAGFVVGGTITTAAAVLLYLNRERRIEVNESGRRVSVSPMLTPTVSGVAVVGAF